MDFYALQSEKDLAYPTWNSPEPYQEVYIGLNYEQSTQRQEFTGVGLVLP